VLKRSRRDLIPQRELAGMVWRAPTMNLDIRVEPPMKEANRQRLCETFCGDKADLSRIPDPWSFPLEGDFVRR